MRSAVFVVALLALFFLVPTGSFACDCFIAPEAENLRRADLVFEGELIRVERKDNATFDVFRVDRIVKGTAESEVFIRTGRTNCDSEFVPETVYRIYARYYQGELITGQCSGNKVLRVKKRSQSALPKR